MNTTAFGIAVLRAKAVARRSVSRAVGLLIAAGVALVDAAHFVFTVLRQQRKASQP